MNRVISLWLPYWASERHARARSRGGASPESPARAPDAGRPLVLVESGRGGVRLAAVDPAAATAGLAPGMTLADARALAPEVAAAAADRAGDARALAALADWCGRFTPRAAVDGDDGLVLDVSGCARLFGGEAALLARVLAAVRRRGVTARAALADSPAAAWAAARFLPEAAGEAGALIAPGGARARLAALPVAALRLPADAVFALERLGLRRIGDLDGVPRAPLAKRFGGGVARRLDQALGRADEAVAPRRPAARYRAHRAFAEPLADPAGVHRALAALADALCRRLAADGRGARRLELALTGVDGARRTATAGAARPSRDPAHLARLLAPRLETLDLGFGIEAMALAAPATGPLAPVQPDLMRRPEPDPGDLAALVDRLANRLGAGNVVRFAPRASHVPERAAAAVPAMAPAAGARWRDDVRRPLRLFPRPEPVEAVAMVPDAPPSLFRWRGRAHRVARAEGPERIAAEWWRAAPGDAGEARDYYRVEDAAGARFWLYRDGPYGPRGGARWYLHGLFG